MARQEINIGASANDGTGDQLRDAFDKVNDNSLEVYSGTATVVRTSVPALPHGVAGDLRGMIAYDAAFLYVCVLDYVDDATISWHRIAIAAPAAAVTW